MRHEDSDPPFFRQAHAREQGRECFAGKLAGFDDEPAAIEAVDADGRAFAATDAGRDLDGGKFGQVQFRRDGFADREAELGAHSEAGVLRRALFDE